MGPEIGLLICQATFWVAILTAGAVTVVSIGLLVKELLLWALGR